MATLKRMPHKRKIDPKFATVEEAEKAATAGSAKIDPEFAAVEEAAVQSFFCSVCGTGHVSKRVQT